MSISEINQDVESSAGLDDAVNKEPNDNTNDELEITVRKIDFPVKPRGVLAE